MNWAWGHEDWFRSLSLGKGYSVDMGFDCDKVPGSRMGAGSGTCVKNDC